MCIFNTCADAISLPCPTLIFCLYTVHIQNSVYEVYRWQIIKMITRKCIIYDVVSLEVKEWKKISQQLHLLHHRITLTSNSLFMTSATFHQVKFDTCFVPRNYVRITNLTEDLTFSGTMTLSERKTVKIFFGLSKLVLRLVVQLWWRKLKSIRMKISKSAH